MTLAITWVWRLWRRPSRMDRTAYPPGNLRRRRSRRLSVDRLGDALLRDIGVVRDSAGGRDRYHPVG